MLKRNCTPSLTHRKKIELIPHPPKKEIVSKETDLLVLPLIKDNIEENKIKNDKINYKINSSKKIGKNRFSIDYKNKKILSPINTELNLNKKRGSKCEENSSKYLLKIKGKDNINDNSKDKNSKNINNFNRNKRIKNINNIQTEFLPILGNNNQSNSQLKFPLIEKNLYHIKSDKKVNKIEKKSHHKYKSDTLLDKEYNLTQKRYATYSRKGTEEDGKNKENNQDISIILNNICEIENYCIYGIMDGHGSNGHLVSNFVKEKIEAYFNNRKIYKSKKLTKAVSSLDVNLSDKIYETLINNNYEIIKNFYNRVNQELYDTKFDIHFSGTTCIIVFKIGQKIICSNVGDSRAILVKNKMSLNKKDKEYEFIELSHDHKPENKEERERIEKLGGEVAQEYLIGKEEEPTGPFRVWCKGYDYPGIAISRSLGDKIAELIGVVSDPDILNFDLDNNCKYIIMGSDGLFDYLSNNDIMNIANPFLINNNPEKACHEIVEKAAQLFKEKEGRIDDITINIIIL